ncbi:VOC family protein [Undibacterium sp. SXout7W]|uniref:VOC family protein n=1 Tax=Undibacterium sp. SXout7W TaxID=3413049 RepID=UPI003BF39D87
MEPNFILLYVSNPQSSTHFYRQLLQRSPVESSPTFSMFTLQSGVMLGLWAKHAVLPVSEVQGGASELAIAVSNRQAVDACYADWIKLNIPMLQIPTELDFGYTFVGVDPDGHRLRIFAPHS